MMPSGITPGHHLLLHLKSPCIRCPTGPCRPVSKARNCCGTRATSFGERKAKERENKPLEGCQTGNWVNFGPSGDVATNYLFSDFPVLSAVESEPAGNPKASISRRPDPRRPGSALLHRHASSAATDLRKNKHQKHKTPKPPNQQSRVSTQSAA